MPVKIQFKRGLNANFTSQTLLAGEPAFVTDTKHLYIGDGTDKILINPVTSVATKTGDVTLSKSDVGLGNVDNTADSTKNVLSASKLTTARTINGVSFDGSANITVADSTKEPVISVKNTAFNQNFETTVGNIKANGTASVGTSANVPRADHVHPSDTTKVDKTITVNGHALSSNVTVTASDVNLGNVTNESKATMFTSPAFTGSPTAPTPVGTDNSTNIATTAFVNTYVNSQPFIKNTDNIDGGTF